MIFFKSGNKIIIQKVDYKIMTGIRYLKKIKKMHSYFTMQAYCKETGVFTLLRAW